MGLGVLSFAFVCQHSAFIVAGSLERPTKKRWAHATSTALSLCVVLEAACGIAGYLAFLENTEGKKTLEKICSCAHVGFEHTCLQLIHVTH